MDLDSVRQLSTILLPIDRASELHGALKDVVSRTIMPQQVISQ